MSSRGRQATAVLVLSGAAVALAPATVALAAVKHGSPISFGRLADAAPVSLPQPIVPASSPGELAAPLPAPTQPAARPAGEWPFALPQAGILQTTARTTESVEGFTELLTAGWVAVWADTAAAANTIAAVPTSLDTVRPGHAVSFAGEVWRVRRVGKFDPADSAPLEVVMFDRQLTLYEGFVGGSTFVVAVPQETRS